MYHRIKTITVIFSRSHILIQKIHLFRKANGEVKCCSHCSNRQNSVGIVLKPSACNVLFESDRNSYLKGPYISCGSRPFQTLISSNPPLLTRVENCVRIHTYTRSHFTAITDTGTSRIKSLDFVSG